MSKGCNRPRPVDLWALLRHLVVNGLYFSLSRFSLLLILKETCRLSASSRCLCVPPFQLLN
jgi:hypothetical protein